MLRFLAGFNMENTRVDGVKRASEPSPLWGSTPLVRDARKGRAQAQTQHQTQPVSPNVQVRVLPAALSVCCTVAAVAQG